MKRGIGRYCMVLDDSDTIGWWMVLDGIDKLGNVNWGFGRVDLVIQTLDNSEMWEFENSNIGKLNEHLKSAMGTSVFFEPGIEPFK